MKKHQYSPSFVYSYISKLHRGGWEKRKYEDSEYVHQFEFFLLEEVNIGETIISSQHPSVANKYASLSTPFPPIVLDGKDRFILDGNHRTSAANIRGDKKIMAYVGYGKYEMIWDMNQMKMVKRTH